MAVPSSKELSLKEMTAGIFEELKERKGWSLEKQPEAGLSLCGQPIILRALGAFEGLDGTADVLIFALFEGQTGCGMEKGLVSSKRRSWLLSSFPCFFTLFFLLLPSLPYFLPSFPIIPLFLT